MPPYLGRIVPRTTRIFRLPSQLQSRAKPLPLYLLTRPEVLARRKPTSQYLSKELRNYSTTDSPPDISSSIYPDSLPVCCPGCGAYTQTVEPAEPGYYSKTRKHVRKLGQEAQQLVAAPDAEGEKAAERIQQYIAKEAADWGESSARPKRYLEKDAAAAGEYLAKTQAPIQICDRCHDLLHHNRAVPAISPSIDSIRAYLDESPHKHNHVYHLVDAADFPMSLIPNIYKALNIMEPRSRNRRSATHQYSGSKRLPTLHIVITRSDLLAPTWDLVNSKMEYIRKMLRIQLNLSSEEFRLGQVHMISAQRGWWTKQVKEEIQNHVGGVWVVGKANVGKSSFIEACFPKDSRNLEKIADLVEQRDIESKRQGQQQLEEHPSFLDSDSLLPPAPREDMFPVLPVVSTLAGTTVSPIRIPFGRGRGEMIDLPGLERGDLTNYVRPEHQRNLMMTKRVKPERLTVKPGQSLLLCGGLIRITAVRPDDIILAACFVPFETHVTRTDKAIEMQRGDRPYPGDPILRNDTVGTFASAGRIDLQWDVTHSHLPTSIAKAVADHGKPIPELPYRVMAADVLIEGCGWVELTVQTRARSHALTVDEYDEDMDDDYLLGASKDVAAFSRTPQVEVFTPHGRHIGSRAPLECYKYIAEKEAAVKRQARGRGRQSISHQKRVKASRRASSS
ncbi:uncharacterized protein BO95DRAFT_514193 [Aspergillus brunneoviolaceus CBS 621.78]|uniref:Uncharacterized protein n=1 Tax=Aspergillus brunneoviolaceus CBS 621.78 TaxID=1450534 RepID=A0ACD1GA02_9EURO|nr:hypothetical protein BO95DRAFT_514193 [Aspergillus brunneoviolaceus CBS 621.78]RAH46092.1 hypothetical protein BO95DRAFT_514193 [Aspergillus brunneoviolaceus CBS 621.78]